MLFVSVVKPFKIKNCVFHFERIHAKFFFPVVKEMEFHNLWNFLVFLGLFVLFNTITIKNKLFILYSDPAFIYYSKNKTHITHGDTYGDAFEYGFVLTLYLFSFIFSFFNSISCKIIGSQQVTKNNLFSEIWKQ